MCYLSLLVMFLALTNIEGNPNHQIHKSARRNGLMNYPPPPPPPTDQQKQAAFNYGSLGGPYQLRPRQSKQDRSNSPDIPIVGTPHIHPPRPRPGRPRL